MRTYKKEIQNAVREMQIKMGVIPAPDKNEGIDHDKIKAALEAMAGRKAAKPAAVRVAEKKAAKRKAAAAAKTKEAKMIKKIKAARIESKEKAPKKKHRPRDLDKPRPRNKKIYSAQERKIIIDDVMQGLARGYCVTQTVKKYGTSLSTFSNWIREAGLTVPARARISTGKKKLWTTIEKLKVIKEAERMKYYGGSYVQVCEKYNVCPSTFREWRRNFNSKKVSYRQNRIDNGAKDFETFLQYMNAKPFTFRATCRHLGFDDDRMRRLTAKHGYKYNTITKQIEKK